MTTIKLKNGSGAPTAGDLAQGEPALDLTNKRLYTEDSGGTVIEVGTNPTSVTTGAITGSGDMAIDTDTLFVDVSADSVGIGTSSPSASYGTLTVAGTGITINEDNAAKLQIGRYNASNPHSYIKCSPNSSGFKFSNASDTADLMVIENSGNVGIGRTPVAYGSFKVLDLAGSAGAIQKIIHTGSTVELQSYASSTVGAIGTATSHPFLFTTGDTERMRIDSSGNLLVGKSTTSFSTDGVEIKNDQIWSTNTSSDCISLNRKTTDGALATFYKDGSTVGSINCRSGQLSIGVSDTGLEFNEANDNILPFNVTTSGGRDDAIDIGADGIRFKDLYLSGSVTSGANGGLIKEIGGDTSVVQGAVGLRINDTASAISPTTASANNDASVDLGVSNIRFKDLYLSGTPYIGGTSSGQSIIQMVANSTNGANTIHFGDSTSGAASYVGYINYAHDSNSMQFAAGGTERMRIDSSGNLLVGKTSLYSTDQGIHLDPDGTVYGTRPNNASGVFNRKTSDGNIVIFEKDGTTTVGSIGCYSGDLTIGNGSTVGLIFEQTGSDRISPWNLTANATRDGEIDLGDSNQRFKDIYASNGTIQTSDRNEKQDIEELSDAEQRVAVAAKGLLRKFRWIDSVAGKGDEARIHFGIIAQDLQDAFTAEGLDAGRYAMFINSTWTDEETGEERSRMGVRYSELLAFIISAI